MYKIFAVVAFLAAASAAPGGPATSFVSFNDNHNSVNHVDSAPAITKYAAPATSVYAAAPAAPTYYSAPAVTKVAVPTIAKFAVPAPSVYAAPVAKVAYPVVAKQAIAPSVTKYVAAPAYAPKEEAYGPAQYEFAYVVEDPHTGDYHSQQEHRDGDHVVGQYSLHEADGTVRLVKYSDEGHGFNAVVERQGEPTPAPVYKKVVAAPAYHY